jgi:hypothetical protein
MTEEDILHLIKYKQHSREDIERVYKRYMKERLPITHYSEEFDVHEFFDCIPEDKKCTLENMLIAAEKYFEIFCKDRNSSSRFHYKNNSDDTDPESMWYEVLSIESDGFECEYKFVDRLLKKEREIMIKENQHKQHKENLLNRLKELSDESAQEIISELLKSKEEN